MGSIIPPAMEIIPVSKFDACPSGSFNLRFQKFAGCARSDERQRVVGWSSGAQKTIGKWQVDGRQAKTRDTSLPSLRRPAPPKNASEK